MLKLRHGSDTTIVGKIQITGSVEISDYWGICRAICWWYGPDMGISPHICLSNHLYPFLLFPTCVSGVRTSLIPGKLWCIQQLEPISGVCICIYPTSSLLLVLLAKSIGSSSATAISEAFRDAKLRFFIGIAEAYGNRLIDNSESNSSQICIQESGPWPRLQHRITSNRRTDWPY